MCKITITPLIPPRLPVVAICLLCASTGNLFAGEVLEGPVPAQVERVIDGDTVAVVASIWPGQTIRVYIRVNGVDTPELRGKCPHEKKLAQFARDYVVNWTYSGWVRLKNIKRGKYAGRMIADVFDNQGRSLADGLLKNGLAHVYSGGRKTSWCDRDAVQTSSRIVND